MPGPRRGGHLCRALLADLRIGQLSLATGSNVWAGAYDGENGHGDYIVLHGGLWIPDLNRKVAAYAEGTKENPHVAKFRDVISSVRFARDLGSIGDFD
ncbi:hypothetical protein OG216_00030 [Streptomycetaceae bacterium NBC_01309]